MIKTIAKRMRIGMTHHLSLAFSAFIGMASNKETVQQNNSTRYLILKLGT